MVKRGFPWFEWLREGFHGLNGNMEVSMVLMVKRGCPWFAWLRECFHGLNGYKDGMLPCLEWL